MSCGGFLHPASSHHQGHGGMGCILSLHGLSSHLLPIQLLPLMEIVRGLGPARVPTAVMVGRVGRQRKCLCVEKEGRSFSAPTWSQYFANLGTKAGCLATTAQVHLGTLCSSSHRHAKDPSFKSLTMFSHPENSCPQEGSPLAPRIW